MGARDAVRDSFFAKLPRDALSVDEELLRDAIFEFLATWKSQDLASLSHLTCDPLVQRRRTDLLPGEVHLKEWIERRIGGELGIVLDDKGQHVIDLSPESRVHVLAKFEQMQKAGFGRGETANREAFFGTLPADELLPEEISLRQCLLDWLQRHRGVSLLAEAGMDPTIHRWRNMLLPPKVSLQDWIERRIGAEVELRPDGKARGQYQMILVNSMDSAAHATGRGWQGQEEAKTRRGRQPQAEAKSSPARAQLQEEFLSRLHPSEFSDAECNMRAAIINYLGRGAAVLAEALRDASILQCQQALLPEGVPLQVWIERRIGGEVEVLKDKGVLTMRLRRSPADVAREKLEGKELFFASLPADDFTPEEERLRQVIMAFLDTWAGPGRPALSQVGASPPVRSARKAVLPSGSASLKDWILRRIGGEIQVEKDSKGQWVLGHFGSFDFSKKRKLETDSA